MQKTLVIAEKPSVGDDLRKVLPGPFKKGQGFLEGPQHVVTWAVGHLVQLADPDEYGAQYAKWRMSDLPILPKKFKLVVRDERAKKQMTVISRELRREDLDFVINACDAGREGELIFAYLYEKTGSKLPVKRLWLNSMTTVAIRDAFASLRPGEEFHTLEEAARSRSEADWIVGMNASRAATIRLRSSFDGAVSLGRVQTPTLAILARREQEIRGFRPEPYWVVDARFLTLLPDSERAYDGRYHAGSNPRIADERRAREIVAACQDAAGVITKLDKRESRDRAPLLYDLSSLQRDASSRYGFYARRTLAAAQRLYEEHKALTYPRTNSRYITSDMAPDIKPIAELVGSQPQYAAAGRYVTSLDVLPLARVVNDEKVTDHHAIIPTLAERHPVEKMNDDDRRIYDLVVRRFLAVFHPEAVFENTRVETTVAEQHVFRTSGRVLLVAGWRAVYGEGVSPELTSAEDDDEGTDQQLPRLEKGEQVRVHRVAAVAKETKPPRRFSDGSLIDAMETAGRLVDNEELREAMKDSGIGTPATRAAIIERLLAVGYIERDGRALVVTEKGMNVIRLLGEHALTSPSLTGEWEHRLAKIETGQDTRAAFMADIAKFATETVATLDNALKDVRIPRANLGPCPVCGQDIMENRKGYSCWSREDPGCGFVIWKAKAGKNLTTQVARELIKTGRTEQPLAGFKSRAGKSFRSRLALVQTEEGRWRVEFDEPWAKAGAKPPAADELDAETQDGAGAELGDSGRAAAAA
ncbi:MAG: DNA topoisomerase 3 [Solirubrobacteraceae bacterium]